MDRAVAVDSLVELILALGKERGERWGWKGDVAKELGLDRSTLTKLLKGDRSGVSVETLEKIAKRSKRFHQIYYGTAAPSADTAEPRDEENVDRLVAALLRALGVVERDMVQAMARVKRAAGNASITPEIVEQIAELFVELRRRKRAPGAADEAAADAPPRTGPRPVMPSKPRER